MIDGPILGHMPHEEYEEFVRDIKLSSAVGKSAFINERTLTLADLTDLFSTLSLDEPINMWSSSTCLGARLLMHVAQPADKTLSPRFGVYCGSIPSWRGWERYIADYEVANFIDWLLTQYPDHEDAPGSRLPAGTIWGHFCAYLTEIRDATHPEAIGL